MNVVKLNFERYTLYHFILDAVNMLLTTYTVSVYLYNTVICVTVIINLSLFLISLIAKASSMASVETQGDSSDAGIEH